MINNKIIAIDARMIEMSGIGTYIQHLMGQGIYDYAIGNREIIQKYDTKVKIIEFDAPIYGLKEQWGYPVKLIKKKKIDLIHFPHYNVPLIYKADYVTTVHDLTHIILPEFLGSKIKYYYAKMLMYNALKKAKHIFTVSNNSKNDIERYFGIESKNISITYNAIDIDFTEKSRNIIEYLYEKFNIPRNQKIVLYVGNLKPHKNLSTLLKAFSVLEDDNVILLLVGKEFKNTRINDEGRKLEIENKLLHIGVVSKAELIDIYNLADVFVFPSLYEGFGIPPLEAMACGTPVIAANNSSIPEVVGDAAILVKTKDADSLS